ncbi:MAG: hypothetical protein ACRD0A_00500 [Acidimicrobiales bacterium]
MSDGLDVSRLSPSDSATSFRSLARRFRRLFTGFEDDETADALLNRPGADGRSATLATGETGQDLAAADEALRQTLVTDGPDVTLHTDDRDRPATPREALELVTSGAERLAARIDDTDADDWRRRARVDGRDMSALDLVRGAVKTTSDGYRAAERAVDEARRALG